MAEAVEPLMGVLVGILKVLTFPDHWTFTRVENSKTHQWYPYMSIRFSFFFLIISLLAHASDNHHTMARGPHGACIGPAKAVREVANLSFPRCSCCKTEWYKETECNNNDSDKMEACKAFPSKSKRERPSHYKLFPMPECSCITRLALPPLPMDIFSEDHCENPQNVLSQIRTHAFPHLAICKSCLQSRINASKEVTEHDYRQGHIHNGQRNVRFTVEPNCVQCKRKFRVRELEKLLRSEGPAAGDTRKKGSRHANWWEALESTIRLVGWAKREQKRERKRMRKKRRMEHFNSDNEQNTDWWEKCNGFTGGDDNYSSDDCFLLSSDSSDDSDPTATTSRPTKTPHRLTLKSGELEEELMKKCPLFRQEKEDEQYVRQMQKEEEEQKSAKAKADEEYAKKLLQEEENAKIAEEQRDHQMATKLHEELKTSSSRFSPRIAEPKKNLITEAWNREASTKKQGRKKPSVDETDFKMKQPEAVGAALSDDDRQSIDPLAFTKRSRTGESSTAENSIEILADSSDDDDCDLEKSATSSCKTGDSRRKKYKRLEQKTNASAENFQIDDIVSMGFGRDSVLQCLKDADGNVEMAVAMLLSAGEEVNS